MLLLDINSLQVRPFFQLLAVIFGFGSILKGRAESFDEFESLDFFVSQFGGFNGIEFFFDLEPFG